MREYVIFTYIRDKDCLVECVKAIRRVDSEAKIRIVDDATNLCGPLDGCEYEISNFPRGGNLVGIPCVDGILEFLAKSSADEVFKIDSDTLLVKRPEFQKTAFFYEGGNPLVGVGICYGMKPSRASECREYFKNYLKVPHAKYPEDLIICLLNLHIGDTHVEPRNHWVQGYQLDKQWNKLVEFNIIHFGNFNTSLDRHLHRELIAAHMKMFNDYIDSRPNV